MIFVIAEKPNLAKTIAFALGCRNKQDAMFINEDKSVGVSWAYGHLFTLAELDDYINPSGEEPIPWKDVKLPFYPSNWKWFLKKDPKTKKVDSGVKKQYNFLKEMINRQDVTEIVHAGDADREGEVIIRLIIMNAMKTHKKISRLWLPEQTEETVRKAFKSRDDDAKYNSLFNEGVARTYVDWLLGINLTRDITLRTGTLCRIGRVLLPIVQAIYDRDKLIKEFTPTEYYVLEHTTNRENEILKISSGKKFQKNQMQELHMMRDMYNKAKLKVTRIDKVEKKKQSPKLYSLSVLQGELGKKLKLKPKEALNYVQKLYEKGYVTYPRTNTEYLSENEKEKVSKIIQKIKESDEDVKLVNKDSKRIYDDSKIESHSAITPTTKIPRDSDLEGIEKSVYETIQKRFLSVFCEEECVLEENIMTLELIDHQNIILETFKIKGTSVIQMGWMKYEDKEIEDKYLPKLNINEYLMPNFKDVAKKTQQPKKYTVQTLNEYLKNPLKKENDTEDEEYKNILEGLEIGTEATRSGIIDNALSAEYISLKNNTYSIESKGIYVIESLRKLNLELTVNNTVILNKYLKDVYRGNMTVSQVIDNTKLFLNKYFMQDKVELEQLKKEEKETLGVCPWCGKPIVKYDTKKGSFYGHKEYKSECQFTLPNKYKYFENEITLTETRVKSLLSAKSISVRIKKKNGDGTYAMSMKLSKEKIKSNNGKYYPKFDFTYKK